MEKLHDKDVRIDNSKYEPDVEPGDIKLNIDQWLLDLVQQGYLQH